MDRFRQYFITDKMAAKLLMLLLIAAGIYSLMVLPTRMIRHANPPIIHITASTPDLTAKGSSQRLKAIETIIKPIGTLSMVEGTAKAQHIQLTLTYDLNTDMPAALKQLNSILETDLSDTSIKNIKTHLVEPLQTVMQILVYGPQTKQALYRLTDNIKQQLTKFPIEIQTIGLGDQQQVAEIKPEMIYQIKQSYRQLADQLKLQDQSDNLQIQIGKNKQVYLLGQLATVKESYASDGTNIAYQHKPAAILKLTQSAHASQNITDVGKQVSTWLTQQNKTGTITLVPFNQNWLYISNKITSLTYSIIISIIVITIVLMCFINWSLCFWIVVGMLTCLLGGIGIYGFTPGASINMVSIFAMLLAVGLVVDDSIVVGEEAYFLWNNLSFDPLKAVMGACCKPSILVATATTLIAFLTLFRVPGNVGVIFRDIPTIVILIILVSLIECLLIMPHHLYRSMITKKNDQSHFQLEAWTRNKLNFLHLGFMGFRDHVYKPFINLCIDYRYATIIAVIMISLVCAGLATSGRVKIDLLDNPQSNTLQLVVKLRDNSKSAINHVNHYIMHALKAKIAHTLTAGGHDDEPLLLIPVVLEHEIIYQIEFPENTGYNKNAYTFLEDLRSYLKPTPEIETISMQPVPVVPLRKDSLEILLHGNTRANTYHNLANASTYLKSKLSALPGVLAVTQNITSNPNHLDITLTENAKKLGLTKSLVMQQIQDAIKGVKANIITLKAPAMPDQDQLSTLQSLPIITPTHQTVTLNQIATLTRTPQIETLYRGQYRPAEKLAITLNPSAISPAQALSFMQHHFAATLKSHYDVTLSAFGSLVQSNQVFEMLKSNLIIAIILIYILLVFVFKSWAFPLIILPCIPISLAGALFGLWVLNVNLSAAAFFGLFGLAGVVINDAIILIMCYRILVNQEGMSSHDAIKQAVMSRSRAIWLTSITTIIALLPAIINANPSSDFILPLAIAMIFGMAVVTFLLLTFIPALLSVYTDYKTVVLHWFKISSTGPKA